MRSLGISISRHALSAVILDRTPFGSKIEMSLSVPCREAHGGPDDIRHLSEAIRKAAGGRKIPPAVISLPPSWTFLRRIELPVADLPTARKAHLSELEGNLPVEDDEILSDLLPPPAGGEPGHYLAIAARKSSVEKAVAAASAAGLRVDRVVTDHVALLCSVLEAGAAIVVSFLNDIVVLRLANGAIAAGRHFPSPSQGSAGETGAELAGEILEFIRGGEGRSGNVPVTTFGDPPAVLSGALPGATPGALPAGIEGDLLLAHGAALVPFSTRETGGFSLRTSAEAATEAARERRRVRLAAAAAAVAVIAGAASIEIARQAEARKTAMIRSQIRKEFSEAVPGVKVIVQETAQVREKIQSLSKQRKELGTDYPAPVALLSRVSQALPPKENISVREMSYDQGRLRLAGDAESPRAVEAYRSSLAAAFGPGTNVTVQESEGSARGGSVRFTILIEKGNGARAS